MRLRRYYKKGVKYPYTISEMYLKVLKAQYPAERVRKIDNASVEIILETLEEEKSWLFDACDRIYRNPRFYLDNIDKVPTFKVHYSKIFPEKVY